MGKLQVNDGYAAVSLDLVDREGHPLYHYLNLFVRPDSFRMELNHCMASYTQAQSVYQDETGRNLALAVALGDCHPGILADWIDENPDKKTGGFNAQTWKHSPANTLRMVKT